MTKKTTFKPKQVTKKILSPLRDRSLDIVKSRFGLGVDSERRTLEAAAGRGVRLLATGDSGRRPVGRRHVHARGPLGPGRGVPGREHATIPRGRART